MSVKIGKVTGNISVSAGIDSITLKPGTDGRITLLTGGMYISNTPVNLSREDAIELAVELVKMVNNG